MPALRELRRRSAGGGDDPNVACIAIRVHVGSGHGIGHPFSVGGNLRLGDAMHFDHVVEGDGMLCGFLCGDCESV
ncbi:MAG: hypothetical protein E6L07_10195 [Verrucomicrobia bacterium]|nr:MAG: hypothetical protein E6L07_10195 [Verrucomicrobiota bacterium]